MFQVGDVLVQPQGGQIVIRTFTQPLQSLLELQATVRPGGGAGTRPPWR